MHSLRLDPHDMSAEINGIAAPINEVFPQLHPSDRFGIVITSSIGLLGASLLIQTFAASYLQMRRNLGYLVPHYPEMYAIHVGGRYGDLRMLDFLPERKEIFVDDADQVLAAINQCGITRLAVTGKPRQPREFHYWETGPAMDRLRTTYHYEVSGQEPEPDIVIIGKGPMILDNLHCIGDIEHTLAIHGPVEEDQAGWEATLIARADEVTPEAAALAKERWEQATRRGSVTESFKVLDQPMDFLRYI